MVNASDLGDDDDDDDDEDYATADRKVGRGVPWQIRDFHIIMVCCLEETSLHIWQNMAHSNFIVMATRSSFCIDLLFQI